MEKSIDKVDDDDLNDKFCQSQKLIEIIQLGCVQIGKNISKSFNLCFFGV